MGVTIHYRGKLKSPALIEPLISEVGALAKEAGWRCLFVDPERREIFDGIFVTLRGIEVQVHPQCEFLNLVFDEKGRLIFMLGLEMIASHGFIVEKEDELGTYITTEMPSPEQLAQLTWDDLANTMSVKTAFTKTQFAGAETHILLCKLLRYLEKKYFAELEVIDEGDYYYKGDASALAERLAFLNHLIENAATSALASLPPGAPIEEHLQDLTRYLEKLAQNAPIKPKF
jgi:hypothetical protein